MEKRKVKKREECNKKGAMQMAISTIIVIILGLAVLVGILLAFTQTGKVFIDTISGYFSKTNVDDIVNNCNREAELGQSYNFCCVDKKIKLEKGKELSMTCFESRNESWGARISEMKCFNVC